MTGDDASARGVVLTLERLRSDDELAKVRSRLAPDEPAFGVRMGTLFEVAKVHTDLDLDEVERLLDHPAYEPRLAAMCILDFRARRRLDEEARRILCDVYLRRHDRITTWDMVDRAAPRVVGGHLAGRPLTPLHDLAGARDPLRRRTAITAPLLFVRAGGERDIAESWVIAGRLAADPDPLVHLPVGTFCKHAGSRDEAALHRFLAEHGRSMARPALRAAIAKLPPADRSRYLR